MTDQPSINQKKIINLKDICFLYSISKDTLWRMRTKNRNTDDPFPKPLDHQFSTRVLFNAKDVCDWFSRNFNTDLQ